MYGLYTKFTHQYRKSFKKKTLYLNRIYFKLPVCQ